MYAIGVLLFHLLTVRYPVEGADLRELRSAHASGTRRFLLDVRPDLPEGLARVVETATSPDVQKRFTSAGQMIAALSGAIGMGSGAEVGRPLTKWRFFRGWMLAPIAVAVATFLLILLPQTRMVLAPRPFGQTPVTGTAGGLQASP